MPELTPPSDSTFLLLLEGALRGSVEVFYAEVSPRCVVPFAVEYDPESQPIGRAAVEDVMARWRKNEFFTLWLYQIGDHFVMSDDYVVWAAIKRGEPDLVPAYVLGRPSAALATNLQGPLTTAAVTRALGIGQ